MKDELKTIQQKVVLETFKNKNFSNAVAQAIGDNIVNAIRKIDDWNLEYSIKEIFREILFTDDFKNELKTMAKEYMELNKDDIKKLISENLNTLLVNGITKGTGKIAELLFKKIENLKEIY